MEEASSASKTAMMVAAYRGRASIGENAVCNDPWAEQLAGPEGAALARQFESTFAHMELWMGLRTAYLDAHVVRWTAAPHHFTQVVILGAGLDTRAARLARPGVVFFEVDHPATQSHKRELLENATDYPLDAARYVACDFERDDFLQQLVLAGMRTDAPTLVVWEGVTAYLTETAVRATARRIAAAMDPRTILAFDHISKRMAQGHGLHDDDHDARRYVDNLGEPLRFGVSDVLPLLHEEGFRWVRQLTFDEICLGLTGTYDRAREFRFQYIALASCTAPDIL